MTKKRYFVIQGILELIRLFPYQENTVDLRRSQAKRSLKKHAQRTLDDGRLPSMEEIVSGIIDPENAHPVVKEYIKTHPELVEQIRREIKLNDGN